MRYRRWGVLLSGLLCGAAVVALGSGAAQADSPSAFDPHSPTARSITTLLWIMLVLAAIVFVLIEGGLLYATFHFRARRDAAEPRQIEGNRRIEIIWFTIPGILVVVLFILALRSMNTIAATPADALHIDVIGHDWWWEYRYPDAKVETANELVVPAGRPVQLDLYSQDVIHSWWVPELAGKTDVIPGKHNTLWFKAEKEGTYLGQCAEFCGLQHAGMRLRVIALPDDRFNQWLAAEAAPATAPAAGDAQAGAAVFAGRTCISCHAVRGSNAAAQVGPDLTHFGARQTLAAGVLDNTPADLARWLANPQAVKPGNQMPNLKLSAQEIQQLVTYLEGLK
ncbi:MAG TPA: cytochrome c oxidase subunit II [Dehalococcoidia bacterium]|nr:cytochrome c oxidase subunit II [Dehalococcoidia bacterium]